MRETFDEKVARLEPLRLPDNSYCVEGDSGLYSVWYDHEKRRWRCACAWVGPSYCAHILASKREEALRLMPIDKDEVPPEVPPGLQKLRDLMQNNPKFGDPKPAPRQPKEAPVANVTFPTTLPVQNVEATDSQVVYQPQPMKAISLVKKLAMITAAVERIPKRGVNSFHNYKFATDSDIFDALRKICAEHFVWVQYSMIPGSVKYEYYEAAGKPRVRTMFDGVVRVFDGESGEFLESFWPAYSHDTDDKGVNKASTAFAKYAMIRLFSISTGEDPDAGHGAGLRPQQQAQHRPQQQPAQRQMTPEEAERHSLIKGAYGILKLDPTGKAANDPIHAKAIKGVADALMLPEVPKKWSEFLLADLRSFAAGQLPEA